MFAHINGGKRLRRLSGTLRHTDTGGVQKLNRCQVVGHKLGHGTGGIQQVVEHEQAG